MQRQLPTTKDNQENTVTRKHRVKQAQGLVISLVIILLLLPALALGADSTMRVYSKLPSSPEGLCLDSKANLYASMPHIGQVVLLKADGSYDHVAWVPSKADSGKGEVFGIDVDKDDNIYLSDLTYAGVWKISADGKKVSMWSDDPLLNWSESSLQLGANPIVIDKEKKNIYVATTTVEGRIVKIPIKADGSAGEAQLVSRGHTYFDGLEIDDAGYLYAAEPAMSQIIVLPPNTIGWIGMTPRKVIGRGAPLQGPTSIVIRDGVLYTANLSFGYPEDQKNKAVVAIENFSRD